ncbi:MAG: hypothetical protein GY847_02630 [Proteobacteria bacterium]|nr:hypothetical protein [Pseudomonadota bacterium]
MNKPVPSSLPNINSLSTGIFILSASVLALELLNMRLLSFALWHHLAYMVLSVAMLGFGASGAWLSSSLKERDPLKIIFWSAFLFATMSVASFMVLSRIQLDTFEIGFLKLFKLGVYYSILLIPYFFAGLVIAAIFRFAYKKTPTLYFFNLLGSGFGCYLFTLVITPLGGPGALIGVSALAEETRRQWYSIP